VAPSVTRPRIANVDEPIVLVVAPIGVVVGPGSTVDVVVPPLALPPPFPAATPTATAPAPPTSSHFSGPAMRAARLQPVEALRYE
jgi:hypothetical protein